MSRRQEAGDGGGDNTGKGNGAGDHDALGPYAPPVGWALVQVRDVGEVRLGRQRSPQHHQGPHMRPYLRVANVFEDRIDTADVMEMNFTPEEFETYRLKLGDILLNEGQSLELVGRPAMYRDEVPGSCFQNTLVRFRAGPAVRPAYALLIFRHYLHGGIFQRIATRTVNIAHLGAGRFAELGFPLPPPAEQDRIVTQTETLFTQLDAGVAALKSARARLRRYRAAVLKAACEGRLVPTEAELARAEGRDYEPADRLLDRILQHRRSRWEADQLAKLHAQGKIPKDDRWKAKYPEPAGPRTVDLPRLPEGWTWAGLEQLMASMRNGMSPKPSDSPPGHRILRINAVRPMRVDLNEVRYLDRPGDEVEGYFIENGDLLFTRYNGSVDLLGVGGLVRGCSEPTLHPDKLIRVQAVLGEPLPHFLEIATNVGISRQHMERRARTTAGQTGISGTDLREMPLPLPPLAEQHRIVAEVERRLSLVDDLDAALDAGLKRAERLRKAILKRAFAGRLIPQDPADEPAAALLDPLRAGGPSARRDHPDRPDRSPPSGRTHQPSLFD